MATSSLLTITDLLPSDKDKHQYAKVISLSESLQNRISGLQKQQLDTRESMLSMSELEEEIINNLSISHYSFINHFASNQAESPPDRVEAAPETDQPCTKELDSKKQVRFAQNAVQIDGHSAETEDMPQQTNNELLLEAEKPITDDPAINDETDPSPADSSLVDPSLADPSLTDQPLTDTSPAATEAPPNEKVNYAIYDPFLVKDDAADSLAHTMEMLQETLDTYLPLPVHLDLPKNSFILPSTCAKRVSPPISTKTRTRTSSLMPAAPATVPACPTPTLTPGNKTPENGSRWILPETDERNKKLPEIPATAGKRFVAENRSGSAHDHDRKRESETSIASHYCDRPKSSKPRKQPSPLQQQAIKEEPSFLLLTPPPSPTGNQDSSFFQSELRNQPLPLLPSQRTLPPVIYVQKRLNGVLGFLTRTYQLSNYILLSKALISPTSGLLMANDSQDGRTKAVLKVTMIPLDSCHASIEQRRYGITFHWKYTSKHWPRKNQPEDDDRFACISDTVLQEALNVWIRQQMHHVTLPPLAYASHILRESQKIYVVYDRDMVL
ncbi:uncharacterized protein BYT42DRAFT_616619 [Radiomyces spectabilis]|uniref:uncharacterized protein n=1 Tax=Radiomyces spectabilis TaxID=64574 RepID=UPI00221F8478|nr:uncharacterized protein BYT42DRAFT_616619 [Radiomyces spectabilis]KAI8371533.1 hypothetical protein BYT42DRAFT_616619 [Radiomyces spectabilis]